MDGHIVNNGSAIAAIMSDLCNLRDAPKSVTTELIQVHQSVINSACSQQSVAVTAGNSTELIGQVTNGSADDLLLASSLQSALLSWTGQLQQLH